MTKPATHPAPPVIDEKLTRQLANLANLELTDAEVTTFTAQLGGILGYVEKLQQADVTGVEPMVHPVELETALREDVVVPSPRNAQGRPLVLDSAPEQLHDGFKVPPIL